MNFLPSDFFTRVSPEALVDPVHAYGCTFCARRYAEMYLLPSFGLADAHEPVMVACAECYQQVTFTRPRASARVIQADATP